MAAAAIVQAHTRAPAIAGAVVGEWYSTGDIGRVDEDGYFYLVVRENIWPSNKPSPGPQLLAGDCCPSHLPRSDRVTAYIDRHRWPE
jgi:hypothetical protein